MDRLHVHGTYPYDTNKWRWVKNLTHDEAADLVKAPEEVRQDEYMWLNKGFIVLDLTEETRTDGLKMAVVELLGNWESKHIKPGMRAVYLHDGSYSLIERR